MDTLVVEVVSVDGSLYAGPARFVVVPAQAGDLGVLPGHAPLMARLRPGDVRIDAAETLTLFVTGGFVEVQPGQVTVLADLAYRGEQLDAAAASARELAVGLRDRQQRTDGAEQLAQTLVEAAARYRMGRRLVSRQRG